MSWVSSSFSGSGVGVSSTASSEDSGSTRCNERVRNRGFSFEHRRFIHSLCFGMHTLLWHFVAQSTSASHAKQLFVWQLMYAVSQNLQNLHPLHKPKSFDTSFGLFHFAGFSSLSSQSNTDVNDSNPIFRIAVYNLGSGRSTGRFAGGARAPTKTNSNTSGMLEVSRRRIAVLALLPKCQDLLSFLSSWRTALDFFIQDFSLLVQ